MDLNEKKNDTHDNCGHGGDGHGHGDGDGHGHGHGYGRILHDLKVGFSIGIAQAIVGHPLDTVKVIWQNKLTFSQVGIVRPLDLYRGFSFPFALNLCTNMTVFPIYEWSKNLLLGRMDGVDDGVDGSEGVVDDGVRNRVSFISGCIAGGLSTPVVYVFDVGKIKKQVNPKFNVIRDFSMFYTTPGIMMTFWREAIGTGFYFYSYDRFVNYFGGKYGGREGKGKGMYYDIMIPFFGGSLAGLMAWTTTYCIDVVRTKQMTFDMSIRHAFYHDSSWRGLWSGYLPCASRSIIVNGISFVIYHAFSSSLEKN